MYEIEPKRRKRQRMAQFLMASMSLLLLHCNATRNMGFDKQGHRGSRGLMPENTIPAMYRALDLQVNTLEMDVVISADKKPVVSHDPYFSAAISTRPDGKTISVAEEKQYRLYSMSYEEIRKWDVGSKGHPLFPQQQRMKVCKPLLEDLIDSVERYASMQGRKPPHYNIETKCSPAGDGIYHPSPEEFTDLLMQVVNDKKIAARTTVQSFDKRSLQVMHRKYPGVRISYLIGSAEKTSVVEQINDLGFLPDVFSPEYRLVTKEMVRYCHRRKIRIVPWTVNDLETIKKLKEMGVDGIISDYPNLFSN